MWPAGRARLAAAARGATLSVLAWAGALLLGVFEALGFAPPHAFLLAALFGAAAATLGRDVGAARLLRALAGTVALLLVLATSLPVTRTLARGLVRRDGPPAAAAAAAPALPFDAVAVLSGSVGSDGLVQGQALDRLLAGLALAQRTGRPVVVSVIRARRSTFGRAPAVSSLADQRRLAALAGLGDRLYAVDSVHTTHDEALRMAALARAQGWRRVALVTSPAHTRRACATFERAGLPVVCTPAPARDATWDGPDPLRTPGDRLRATANWLYETAGWAVYRVRGWV